MRQESLHQVLAYVQREITRIVTDGRPIHGSRDLLPLAKLLMDLTRTSHTSRTRKKSNPENGRKAA